MAPIRVLIVDDHRSFADALALAVGAVPELECVGVVGTALEAFEAVAALAPDAVVLDLALPDLDGILVAEQLHADAPACRIFVLTGGATADRMARAGRAGVDGFLAKEASLRTVLDALVDSADGLYVDQVTLALIVEGQRVPDGPSGTAPWLTDREEEVLEMLATGAAVKLIATKLDITVNTCRGHIRSILSKLGVHSQLAAVVRAAELGMVPGPVAPP